jgi:hypothetical protein
MAKTYSCPNPVCPKLGVVYPSRQVLKRHLVQIPECENSMLQQVRLQSQNPETCLRGEPWEPAAEPDIMMESVEDMGISSLRKSYGLSKSLMLTSEQPRLKLYPVVYRSQHRPYGQKMSSSSRSQRFHGVSFYRNSRQWIQTHMLQPKTRPTLLPICVTCRQHTTGVHRRILSQFHMVNLKATARLDLSK